MEQQDLSEGRLIRDRYQLAQKIGEGGMGEVWAAFNPRLPKVRYAIKFLFGHTQDSEQFNRFQREAKILSALSHENITQIHDVDFSHDPPFIVLEYLQGEPLSDRLKTARDQGLRGLPLYEVIHIARQVGAALTATHAQEVIHRDLKPENIFLCHTAKDPLPWVKMLDFGVSKMSGEQKITQHLHGFLGTPQYMSPEQALGHDDLDHRADQFAFAIILYEMISGELPFKGEQIVQIATQIVHGDPAYIRELAPNLPDEAAQALHRALCKSPEDRFPSCEAFLNEFLSGVERGSSDDEWSTENKTEVGVRQSIIQGELPKVSPHVAAEPIGFSGGFGGGASGVFGGDLNGNLGGEQADDLNTVQIRYQPEHFQRVDTGHPLEYTPGYTPNPSSAPSSHFQVNSTPQPDYASSFESAGHAHPTHFPSDHYYESSLDQERYPSFNQPKSGSKKKWVALIASIILIWWALSGAPSVSEYAHDQLNSSGGASSVILDEFKGQVRALSLLHGKQRKRVAQVKQGGRLPSPVSSISVASGLNRALFFIEMDRSPINPSELSISWYNKSGAHLVNRLSAAQGTRAARLWQTARPFSNAHRGEWLIVVSHQERVIAHLKFEVK